MILGDIFKIGKFKSKISSLETQLKKYSDKISELELLLSPEQKEVLKLKEELKMRKNSILELNAEIKTKQTDLKNIIDSLNETMTKLNKAKEVKDLEKILELDREELNKISSTIVEKRKSLVELNDEILVQEFGLYTPKYNFMNSEEYKAKLIKIRQKQKNLIKEGKAVHANFNWTVNDSTAKGKKMVKDMQKLLLRAFNSECDEIINKVRYNSFDSCAKRISSSYEAVSKLGTMMDLYIEKEYYDSKIDELTVALEYQLKKQEEKDLKKELRDQMREEAKLQREIENERRKIEKEERHYKIFLSDIKKRIKEAKTKQERDNLLSKQKETENKIQEIAKSYAEIDYREANQKAGYVYVISNIGSFGENVYKIGMTRRLVPEERVDELGDSSVPFDFDIHAMIFSQDAPKLEHALHKAFENKKVNMVNKRREFFNVTLDEIKSVVKANFDRIAEFKDIAEANDYRISQKMREQVFNTQYQ